MDRALVDVEPLKAEHLRGSAGLQRRLFEERPDHVAVAVDVHVNVNVGYALCPEALVRALWLRSGHP